MVHAVMIRNLQISYGKTVILNNMNMTVPLHTIFALLGPSGCGKTTLLKCVLGRKKCKKGFVRVFGHIPGTKGSRIPGSMVGFMPQEIALYMEFTLLELLIYFGTIYKMRRTKILEKYEFLTKFLDLPKTKRQLNTFSGGQQRRASLAAALLHEPELIILDEPTVGVDPMLRETIWKFLVKIVSHKHTTVIVTTHYVEEARQANVVGMLRGGRLLAEDSPDALMEKYEKSSLEGVFLQLCILDSTCASKDDLNEQPQCVDDNIGSSIVMKEDTKVGIECVTKSGKMKFCTLHYPWSFVALLTKNIRKMGRNIPFLVFQFILPVIQVIIFFGCIGREPHHLNFGVINRDKGFNDTHFGKAFVARISDKTFDLHEMDDEEEAIRQTEDVDLWGFVMVKENFTHALMKRLINPKNLTQEDFDSGSIHVYMDMTNQQVAITIRVRLDDALARSAASEVARKRYKNPAIMRSPIVYEKPLYGDKDPAFTDFMVPGVICIILSFMASGLTAMTFVQEKKEGLLERSFVAGVGIAEVFLAHVVAQFLVLFVQNMILLIISFAAYKVPCRGDPTPMVFLTLLVGIFGMAMGFLISAACDREETAIQITIGTAYPNILLNGIIWPRSGMPYWLNKFSLVFPLTLPVEALRSVMLRGLSIKHRTVWMGYVVILVWIAIFVKLCFIILKRKGV